MTRELGGFFEGQEMGARGGGGAPRARARLGAGSPRSPAAQPFLERGAPADAPAPQEPAARAAGGGRRERPAHREPAGEGRARPEPAHAAPGGDAAAQVPLLVRPGAGDAGGGGARGG